METGARPLKRSRRVTMATIAIIVALSLFFYSVYLYVNHQHFPRNADVWVFEGSGNLSGSFLAMAMNQSGDPLPGIRFEFNFLGVYDHIIVANTTSSGIALISTGHIFSSSQETVGISAYEGSGAIFALDGIALASPGGLIASFAATQGTWGKITGGSNITVPVGTDSIGVAFAAPNLTQPSSATLYFRVAGSTATQAVEIGSISLYFTVFTFHPQPGETYEFMLEQNGTVIYTTQIQTGAQH